MQRVSSDEKFLKYYHRELKYLRTAGKIFAHKHPKIARRLDLGEGESPDPHVERLIETFSFMSARLSKEIDDLLPQISMALLQVLYPSLVNPVPAMGITHFKADSTLGKMTTGYKVPKGTQLYAYSSEDVTCQFTTGYDTTLWPVNVCGAEFAKAAQYDFAKQPAKNTWYIKIRLSLEDAVETDALSSEGLTFHIAGSRALGLAIYEALFAQQQIQPYLVKDGQVEAMPTDSVTPIGIDLDECMLPQASGTHHSYNLLQEYFHFPEKFLFFNVKNISFPESDDYTRVVELLLPLGDAKIVDTMQISSENFLLGCTPVINLFKKITDPVRINHTQYEYRLLPDERRERTTEIHSIQKVFTVLDGEVKPEQMASYFSYKHEDLLRDQQMYWVSRRANSVRPKLEGTDVFVGFVDLNFNPVTAQDRVLYAHTLCTNRILATQLPGGTELEIEDQPPISELYLLDRPTAQVYTPEDGATLWQLVSQLTINHLRVTEQENAAEALKETLRLYAGLNTSRGKEIDAIIDVKAKPIVRRWGKDAWRGFAQGIGIELTMDEAFQSGNSAFLLAFVLQRYFALQVAINSFVELTLNSSERQDIWMRWKPHSGAQPLL